MEGLLALAVLIQSAVEYLAAPIFEAHPQWNKNYQRYIALAFGLAVAVPGKLNAFAFMPGLADVPQFVGYIFTGVLLGGGAVLLHEALAKKNGSAPLLRPSAPTAEMPRVRRN